MTTTAAAPAASSETCFVSPAQLTIANATVLQHELEELLSGAGSIVFDLSGVERVDTSGVQLLLAAVRRAGELGIGVRWEDPSGRLEAASAALGVTSAFATAEGRVPIGSEPSQPGEE